MQPLMNDVRIDALSPCDLWRGCEALFLQFSGRGEEVCVEVGVHSGGRLSVRQKDALGFLSTFGRKAVLHECERRSREPR